MKEKIEVSYPKIGEPYNANQCTNESCLAKAGALIAAEIDRLQAVGE